MVAQSSAGPSARPVSAPKRTRHEGSSQHRRWTYTAEKLESNRTALSQRAVASCERNHAKERELQLAADPSYAPKSPLPPYPTHEDEVLLIRFYLTQLTSVISTGSFGRPLPPFTIEDIALTYLKRFYLRTSCLEWHPKVIMPVCIFLAAKVANTVLDIDAFVAVFDKLRKEDVLELEYLVVQTLRYDLLVPQPKDALRGWYYRLQDPSSPPIQSHVQSLLPLAQSNLRRSRLSDAEHLYTPSQIAAACWRMADKAWFDGKLREGGWKSAAKGGDGEGEDEGATDADQEEYEVPAPKKRKCSEEPDPTADDPSSDAIRTFPLAALLSRLDEIESLISATPEDFDLKKVKVVDKAVRACQDPIKVKTSAIYRKKQELAEAKEAAKRAAKIDRARKEMSSREAVFGPVVGLGDNLAGAHAEKGFAPVGETGMGIKGEGGGMILGGEGLRDVGLVLSDSESD